MEYLSHEHRILKFLAKVKDTGVVSYAHVKFMKPVGNDYAILKDRAVETTPYTDAEFDMAKVKNIFTDRNYMSDAQFDAARGLLIAEGHLKEDQFDIHPSAVGLHRAMEAQENKRINDEVERRKSLGEKVF